MLFFNAYAQIKLKNAIKTKTARFQLLSEKTPQKLSKTLPNHISFINSLKKKKQLTTHRQKHAP
jgi:hypothetical protein